MTVYCDFAIVLVWPCQSLHRRLRQRLLPAGGPNEHVGVDKGAERHALLRAGLFAVTSGLLVVQFFFRQQRSAAGDDSGGGGATTRILSPERDVRRPAHMTRLLNQHRAAILRIGEKFDARNVRIFGSTVRGEQAASSDVDILVDLEAGRSLLDQVGLQQELDELLGQKVDVVVEGGLSPYLEERILAEAVPL